MWQGKGHHPCSYPCRLQPQRVLPYPSVASVSRTDTLREENQQEAKRNGGGRPRPTLVPSELHGSTPIPSVSPKGKEEHFGRSEKKNPRHKQTHTQTHTPCTQTERRAKKAKFILHYESPWPCAGPTGQCVRMVVCIKPAKAGQARLLLHLVYLALISFFFVVVFHLDCCNCVH